MEFKEMRYSTKEEARVWHLNNKDYKRELLGTGEYKGYTFYMLSLGTHPTAYVETPKNHSVYKKEYFDICEIDVHGGITYSESYLYLPNEKLENSWFIGWDYDHWDDYNSMLHHGGKKWTTEEIYEDVKNVIEQLKLMEMGDNNG